MDLAFAYSLLDFLFWYINFLPCLCAYKKYIGKLQEIPSIVPIGQLPGYKEVILLNDLIDCAHPGEENVTQHFICKIIHISNLWRHIHTCEISWGYRTTFLEYISPFRFYFMVCHLDWRVIYWFLERSEVWIQNHVVSHGVCSTYLKHRRFFSLVDGWGNGVCFTLIGCWT